VVPDTVGHSYTTLTVHTSTTTVTVASTTAVRTVTAPTTTTSTSTYTESDVSTELGPAMTTTTYVATATKTACALAQPSPGDGYSNWLLLSPADQGRQVIWFDYGDTAHFYLTDAGQLAIDELDGTLALTQYSPDGCTSWFPADSDNQPNQGSDRAIDCSIADDGVTVSCVTDNSDPRDLVVSDRWIYLCPSGTTLGGTEISGLQFDCSV
jgi:hypothetical protein